MHRPRSLFGRLALGFAAIAVAAVGMSSLLVLVIVTRDVHAAADAEEREVLVPWLPPPDGPIPTIRSPEAAPGRGRGPTCGWPSPWG